MNIGFINIYPWRPHGFHAAFLAYLAKQSGHNIFSLECGGNFDACYSKLIQGGSISRCIKCRSGSLSKYDLGESFKISQIKDGQSLPDIVLANGLVSSSVTLFREEDEGNYFDDERLLKARKLLKANYLKSYFSTIDLIEKNKIDALIVFNGRIDMTRAAIEAANEMGITYITHERPFMGHGIQLNVNENCLGLRDHVLLNQKYEEIPLNKRQACLAGAEIAKRFMGANKLEWRVYNKGSKDLDKWPTETNKEKILIIPSSRSEVGSHEDWVTPWKLSTEGLSQFLSKINVERDQVVVRFHPNWDQKVGLTNGESSRSLYKKWCENEGYYYIDSHESISTLGLIEKCDIAVLNGGSAGIEAAALGKMVVNLGASHYKGTSFSKFIHTFDDISKFSGFDNWNDKQSVIRSVLRYMYTSLGRFPQFCNHMRALSTTNYIAYSGADPSRLDAILSQNQLSADDDEITDQNLYEDEIVNLIKKREWLTLIEMANNFSNINANKIIIEKKFPFNVVDTLRNHFKRGDL